jgi:hypothetical protein
VKGKKQEKSGEQGKFRLHKDPLDDGKLMKERA